MLDGTCEVLPVHIHGHAKLKEGVENHFASYASVRVHIRSQEQLLKLMLKPVSFALAKVP